MKISTNHKKIFYGAAGTVLFAAVCAAAGWFLAPREKSYDPYLDLRGHEFSRHEFMVKSAEVSVKLTIRAVAELKAKKVAEAIEDCRTAIDIFPINAKPYILLTKLYLMMGQEMKMYDVLSRSGNSYPNFDNIVSTIDDDDLDKIPLDEPQDNIYLADFPENKKAAVSFMFDDGEADVYKNLPIFEKYGYRATIPVVAGFASETSKDPFWGSWAEWKDAADRGFEIANHSMYHRDSKDLSGSDFDVAIDQAKEIIEKNTGHPVTAYVFPHDSYTDESISRALRLHKAVRVRDFLRSFYNRTIDIVFGGPHVSITTADRLVDIGIKRKLWLIAKCHGITDKKTMRSFKSITPVFLDKYLAFIHSKSDDVWVDTFSNVFNYLYLRSQTTIETKGSTENSMDFVLHNNDLKTKLSVPLTVIIRTAAKTEMGHSVKASDATDGRMLKAWSCAADKLCVDVDSYNDNIQVQWGSDK